ncbi:hypothetical protein K1719_046253 [Acacia pycnantha]|nr:hypothetical protein K1719_046253 [Acacia pycnantha]
MEFMANGSLDRWLYSHNYYLNVLQRLNIMIDVAAALEYLHHGSSTLVVHCDVKPSNVLLDEDMVAHLGDFGIAKLFGQNLYGTVFELALHCSTELPEARLTMIDVVASLRKIKSLFMENA